MVTTETLAHLVSGVGELMMDLNASIMDMNTISPTENPHTDFELDPLQGIGGAGDGDSDGDVLLKDVSRFLNRILTIGICAALSTFGIVSNIINVIIFVKDGFQANVNISLFAIAMADFASAITLLWYCICHNPLFMKADLPFLPTEVEPLTSGIPHAIAMNATGWLTAFVTFERCLCVVFPLKVKHLLSKRRTIIIVVMIFLFVIGAQMPSYYTLRLGWRFVPERNKTLLGLYAIEGSEKIDEITFYFINVSAPIMSFLIVLTCSGILVIQLSLKSKWRQTVAATSSSSSSGEQGKQTKLTAKDWKVVKMIFIVAVIFITSFTPYVLISTVMTSEPEFRFYGKYRYAFSICVSIGSFLEAINAGCSIFVYYHMSSKYKAIFRSMFSSHKKDYVIKNHVSVIKIPTSRI